MMAARSPPALAGVGTPIAERARDAVRELERGAEREPSDLRGAARRARGVVMTPRLGALVDGLEACGTALDRRRVASLLASSGVALEDVSALVRPSDGGYTRARVARTEHFELLVLTWRPGQKSAAHDHGGSLCAFTVLGGAVRETRFAPSPDGLVVAESEGELREGEILADTSSEIHALENAPDGELLVSLHVYAPPLPELRRYAVRSERAPLPVFTRRLASAPTVAIVGGGFSGTMVAANLVRRASEEDRPLHVVLFDRQAAFGEGPAYRTADARHLLNVPASHMSAWPDRPAHFAEWLARREPQLTGASFAPRRVYGEYVRETLFEVARSAGDRVSLEIRRAEVERVEASEGGWTLAIAGGERVDASALALATGHRPPDDPLRGRWSGPRARYIEDPWSSLALSGIAPSEPVLLLGSGLTAVDALLTLHRGPRSAPVVLLSRRGLLPSTHLTPRPAPLDAATWLGSHLTARSLVTAFRRAIDRAVAEGGDWRSVVDGLRAHTPALWRSLPIAERRRLLRHVRPFWEVHRHRMAPEIGRFVAERRAEGALRVAAGRVLAVEAGVDEALVEWTPRGGAAPRRERFAWVVNCTGPGAGVPKVVQSLVDGGHVAPDPLGLGLLTDDQGRGGRPDLVVVGTLRKPAAWESTAVPELRIQAHAAAHALLEPLRR